MPSPVVLRAEKRWICAVVTAAAILLGGMALLAVPSAQAAPRKFGQRSTDCKKWDCQGGLICSCCFDNGCWICDSDGSKPMHDQCHWEDKLRLGPQQPSRGVVEQAPVAEPPTPTKPGDPVIQK